MPYLEKGWFQGVVGFTHAEIDICFLQVANFIYMG